MRYTILLLLLPVIVVAAAEGSNAGLAGQPIEPMGGAVLSHSEPSIHAIAESQSGSSSGNRALAVRRRVPQDYPTIQAAIDASITGDTVLVSEGTYHENIRYKGKSIVVGSLFVIDGDTAHVNRTIIDGSTTLIPDSGSVVYMIDGEDTTSVLAGFTITGGTGTKTFWFNAWYRFGGGILCHNSGARIVNNDITRNRVRADGVYGGGIGTYTELISLPFLILERNTISSNYATSLRRTPWWGHGSAEVDSASRRRLLPLSIPCRPLLSKGIFSGRISSRHRHRELRLALA